jgi:hypothetical protein
MEFNCADDAVRRVFIGVESIDNKFVVYCDAVNNEADSPSR